MKIDLNNKSEFYIYVYQMISFTISINEKYMIELIHILLALLKNFPAFRDINVIKERNKSHFLTLRFKYFCLVHIIIYIEDLSMHVQ